MDKYIIALIESSAALFFFYFVYVLWLKKLTFFKENRFFLLLTAMSSLLIPWLNFTLPAKTGKTIVLYNLLDTVSISANGYEQSLIQKISAFQWISSIYLLGVLTMLVLFIVRIAKITRLSKNKRIKDEANKLSNVRFIDAEVVPFSFLNKIYINPKNLTKKELTDIIAHENVHIMQQHTYDCLFYELMIVFFWFNPIAYKYRKAAKEIHEYLADEGAIRTGVAKEAYQKLLFEQATGISMLKLANSFSYSLIKNRLVMLTKIRSNKVAKTRMLMVLPVILVLVVVFACNQKETELVSGQDSIEVGDLNIYKVVEEMPEFEGGEMALRKYLAENVQYPQLAKNEKIEGIVFVSFIVNEKGKVDSVKVVRGVHEVLDAEALRVVSSLPDWEKPGKRKGIPVKVRFTFPINFKLGSEDKKSHKMLIKDEAGNEVEEVIFSEVDDMPEFPGGDLALRKFIATHIAYPAIAKESGTEGKVFVQFVVNENGKIEHVKHLVTKVPDLKKNEVGVGEVVVTGYNEQSNEEGKEIEALANEAIRVIGLLPKWKPGYKDGKPVKVQFTVPINFQLN